MQHLWFKIHIIKKLALNHFNVKLSILYFYQSVKTAAYPRPNIIFFTKIHIPIFLTNTINPLAQKHGVFSTIALLLLHNRCRFFSNFSHGDRAIRPIHSTVLSKQMVGSVINMCHLSAITGVMK